jgi:hypothetical protein
MGAAQPRFRRCLEQFPQEQKRMPSLRMALLLLVASKAQSRQVWL